VNSGVSFSFAEISQRTEITFVSEVTKALTGALAGLPITDEQIEAWEKSAAWLHKAVLSTNGTNPKARLVLELAPPFEIQRSDFVIISAGHILVGEAKTGIAESVSSTRKQVEDYARTIHSFVDFSRDRFLVPLIVRARAKRVNHHLPTGFDRNRLGPTLDVHPDDLGLLFAALEPEPSFESTDPKKWLFSPRPNIITAARLMLSQTSDRGVLGALTDDEELQSVIAVCEQIATDTMNKTLGSGHAVVAVTGVPGAGKTLVGLRLAHSDALNKLSTSATSTPPMYLSGNGPLVDVLTEALIRDEVKRTKCSRTEAETTAKAKIRLVHGLTTDKLAVRTHVLIFDEAQRAWTEEHMRRKLRTDEFGSEAEEILKRMENDDLGWSVVICLVGTGQQINSGEKGLSTWLQAIERRAAASDGKSWQLYVDGEVAASEGLLSDRLRDTPALNLRVVRRAHNASGLGDWVNFLLEGRYEDARKVRGDFSEFPIYVSRDLTLARDWLRSSTRQFETCGLVASSKSARLSIYGVDAHTSAGSSHDWPQWYLDQPPNLNSAKNLEVAASEFKCQGLELDWVGICWSWDLIPRTGRWLPRKINKRSGRWNKNEAAGDYLINAYRVLLTRARNGMVIWVPEGSQVDPSRSPNEIESVYQALLSAGCTNLESIH
jgi:hypothetical protein